LSIHFYILETSDIDPSTAKKAKAAKQFFTESEPSTKLSEINLDIFHPLIAHRKNNAGIKRDEVYIQQTDK
jgi:hypothetical protein